LRRGPRGLSSAQAQKFTAKPAVASASISHARPGTGVGAASGAGEVPVPGEVPGVGLSFFVLDG
jgi:hypothetical protein